MVCSSSATASGYRPRRPRESPLYRIIERFFPHVEQIYPERYEKRYGFWRPIIGEVVRKFLRYGDLHFGFARVRCSGSECGHEMFVPLSCRQRCLCPSCHQKRGLLLAERIAHHIGHRQPNDLLAAQGVQRGPQRLPAQGARGGPGTFGSVHGPRPDGTEPRDLQLVLDPEFL